MKFMHLADLHIGKRVNEFSMIEDQEYILRQILQIAQDEQVDGVLIAGDVYDRAIPPADAVRLFDHFLTALARLQIAVFVISGNHDSAERIAFGSQLMNACGVYFSPVFDGTVQPVSVRDQYGEIDVYLLPFLKPVYVRPHFPDAAIESYNDAMAAVIGSLALDKAKRNVLVAHQFVTGAETAGSEELMIGGLDNIDVEIFAGFDYVALGHIHRSQRIKYENVRYGGTPLKYSFSEAKHRKTVTVLEMRQKGDIEFKHIPLMPLRDLREIKGSFAEITAAEKSFDYLHITLTDEEEIPYALGKIRSVYPNVMKLDYDNTRTRTVNEVDRAEDMENKSEIDLFAELYQMQNGRPMSDDQTAFMVNLIEKIKEA